MAFERARYQVDVIAGDGDKACYLATPKTGGSHVRMQLIAVLAQQDDGCCNTSKTQTLWRGSTC